MQTFTIKSHEQNVTINLDDVSRIDENTSDGTVRVYIKNGDDSYLLSNEEVKELRNLLSRL